MPELDLTRARRIRTAAGDLAALKGAGFTWRKPVPGGFVAASGGIVAVHEADGLYHRTHSFQADGTLSVTAAGTVRVLLAGGGQAGGGSITDGVNQAGNGGAGGAVVDATIVLSAGSHPVVVGSGGAPAQAADGLQGVPTAFAGMTAQGGSGSGLARQTITLGGAGNAGANPAVARDGGPGVQSDITGSPRSYGGGGGGGQDGGVPGLGADGGGDGGPQYSGSNSSGADGENGRGGGGGGAGLVSLTDGRFGGKGGAGVVIVAYEITQADYAASA